MLRIVSSTPSLVGSGRCGIVPATNGSQRVGGCKPVLTCSPTVTCSPKTEPKVTVTSSPKTEPKVVKKLKRKSSIQIQICLSKNDNIQIHQYIEMSQDLNPIHVHIWSFALNWPCENHTFNATPSKNFATISPGFCNEPHLLHVLFVKVAPGTTFTSWTKHHFTTLL